MGPPHVVRRPPIWPRPLRAPVEQGFRLVARVRRARAFHPRGATFAATVERGWGPVAPGTPAFVRLSRAAGLPDALPDPSGVAIRLVDVGGPGRHQDLLLTSVWPGWPLLRHVLRATRRPAEALHSSILPLRVDGEARLVTARIEAPGEVAAGLAGLHAAVATGGVRITVAAAPLARADDRPLLELALGRRLSPAEGEALRFDPANAGAGLPPIGLLGLRDAAYAGSSRGRAEAAER